MPHDKYDPFKPRAFVQTAGAALPELDRWRQITDEEVAIVAEMTARNELSGGTPVVRAFEDRWRDWIGSRYALTVMNGTSALYSAYFGLGVGPGDEVICPVNTWICTIAPALLLGARPVFCDVDPDSLMIDPKDARAKITDRTRCICAVHLWGNVCDMDALLRIGEETGIPVIEDCSHAHGARYRGRMCGGMGKAGCWSLQGSKAVSAGEGGVLTTDDTDLFERACLVGQVNRIAGIDLVSTRYAEHQPLGLGMKFRAHPLGIGIAAAQLDKLPELNHRRREFIESVEAGLSPIPGLRPVKVYEGVERGGFYGFPVIHEPGVMGVPTEAYVAALNARGLQATLSPYPNLHDLPLFAKGFDIFTRNRGPVCASEGYRGYRQGDFPNAELAQRRTLFLPRLSDPIPEAAAIILDTLRWVARASRP
ncbi:MAG TPA: DegT/DnrJ/EryC1/StrS family aminotransferase [Candidatus Hydrogenedentes bacterium]|nr:DegT/DnrJ/EryC1/StrS family aminotransferase [Candidatus Hydrogenedentota bacterium]